MKNVPPFREFAFGWMLLALMIPLIALEVYLFVTGAGDRPLTLTWFILISGLLLLTWLLFFGMTTEVSNETIIVSFGLGLIRKRIPISRVASAESVRSPWYYGWGIRLIPNGMMYNIDGLESVELRFKDSRRIFRIGSKRPNDLKREIVARIAAAG